MNRKTKFSARSVAVSTIVLLGFSGPSSADHRNYSSTQRPHDHNSYDKAWNNYHGGGRNCSYYEVKVRGGEGAFRFMHNIPDYRLVRNGTYRGKICGQRHLTVELSKRHPGTHIAFRINGEKYNFRKGEQGHRYGNNWHRKYIKVPVSRSDRYAFNGKHVKRHNRKHGDYAQYHQGNNSWHNDHGHNHHRNY